MYFNGTKSCALLLASFLSLSLTAKDIKTINAHGLQKPLSFVENKGQVKDQDNNPRNDVQYKLSSPGMSLYVGNGQLHYQFQKADGQSAAARLSTYRMDVTLLGANTGAKAISADEQAYYENYFLANSGSHALTAHSFDRITYKDVYPNIDWVLYVKNGKVEYDFVVRPGGNIHDIQLKYDGATALNITKNGGIAAETPMGSVQEKSPYSYETETHKLVASGFVLHNNIVSFETAPYSGSLTIDPYLEWSTYFGGTLEDVATSVKETTTGITFVGGYTASTGLGAGGALHTAALGGAYDGFLAKYDATGALLFTTYFGGTGSDTVTAIALDNTGAGNPNVFIAGVTNSASIGGAPVATYHGLNDGFVAKLDNTGTSLLWVTYYGGSGNDNISAITCDAANNVYVTGQTASVASIATSGTYQTAISGANDAFVAKLSGAVGSVSWGTYFGGTAQEKGFGIATDASNNVFITGYTNSIVGIATGTAAHAALLGTNDAFIAKLNSTGTSVLWGTYYGGSGQEQGNAIACNQSTGDIAVVGNTSSADNIGSVTSYQSAYAGGSQDAFVTYFSNSGVQQWSTYFGGNQPDYGQAVCIDHANNIVIAGGTFSAADIASPNASQPAKAGDYDAYLAKFNPLGQRIWSSYFGGSFYDFANSVAADNNDQLFIAGYTTSSPASGIYGAGGIASTGAAQSTFMGGTYDAFITKFNVDTFVQINMPFSDNLICAGGLLNVGYTANYDFQAGNVFTVQLSDATGSFAVPVTIGTAVTGTSGTIACTIPSGTPVGTGYRIRIAASNPAYISPDDFFDIEVISSLPATTASGTTPVCVGGVISLTDAAPYVVTGYSWAGPAGSGFGGTGFTSSVKSPVNTGISGTGVTTADGGVYTVTTSHNGCPDLTASVTIVVNDVVPPAPILSNPDVTNCAGSAITLFANPDTTAPAITYNWSGPAGFTSTLQNPVITGAMLSNSGTYTLTDLLGGCASASGTITVTVTDTVHVAVTIMATPGDTVCKGTLVTFNAFPVSGGGSATYQWYTGVGTPIVGAVSDVFSSGTLTDGTNVFCTMKSSLLCPSPITAVSNVIVMNVISNPPIVKIFSTANHVHSGGNVMFTSAVYNGGSAPLYQWMKNGVPVPGANSDTFTLYNVTRVDTITLELTSTMLCAVPNYGTSNAIVTQTNVGVATLNAGMEDINLYPNPNNGSFTIAGTYSAANTKTLSIDVVNAVGQMIFKTTATVQNDAFSKSISVKNIPTGVYMIRVTDNAQTKTVQFTVAR